jgi:hypothetical protein
MKYALITEFWPQINNLGDYAQTMAIEYLYSIMGIDETDIVHIGQRDLSDYDGEPLILPYNYAICILPVNNTNYQISLSDKIIPVFLGFSLLYIRGYTLFRDADDYLSIPYNLSFLKQYEPIGCRDAYTRNVLERHGVKAYFQGCITTVLPIMENRCDKKIFFVDCISEIIPFIPDSFINKCEFIDSQSADVGIMKSEDIYSMVKRKYEYICSNAALIVSGRFHIVTPLYAMGVPSFFIERASQEVSRFITINPYISIYAYEDFDKIDWNPRYYRYEELKQKIISIAVRRIKLAANEYTSIPLISAFYENNTAISADNSLIVSPRNWDKLRVTEFIKRYWQNNTNSKFMLYGAKPEYCSFGEIDFIRYVSLINSNIHFVGWIDKYKVGTLCGYPIITPVNIVNDPSLFIIVCAEKAIQDAKLLFEKLNFKENQYLFCTPIRNVNSSDFQECTSTRQN